MDSMYIENKQMISAIKHNKVKMDSTQYCEDSKTSSVFDALLLLDDQTVYEVLIASLHSRFKLDHEPSALLNAYFWPKYSAKDIPVNNHYFVEPDIVLEFESLTIIIEAKIGENGGQSKHQWINEFVTYIRENHPNASPVIMLALGGNWDLDSTETLHSREFLPDIPNRTCIVYPVSWFSLFLEVCKLQTQTRQEGRIKKYIIDAFKIFNIKNLAWLGTIPLCDSAKISKALDILQIPSDIIYTSDGGEQFKNIKIDSNLISKLI